MKLVTSSVELADALKTLPRLTQNRSAEWSAFTDLGFELRCDLLYFDVIDFPMIARLPAILSALDEDKCYVLNFEKLNDTASGPAIEIAATSDRSDILRKLDASNLDKEDFWSSFYLVPRFGLIPTSGNWLVLAECDERAVLLSNHEQKYTSFNSLWWSCAFERMHKSGSTG